MFFIFQLFIGETSVISDVQCKQFLRDFYVRITATLLDDKGSFTAQKVNDQLVELTIIGTLSELNITNEASKFYVKYAKEFCNTLFKVLQACEFGAIEFDKEKSQCSLFQILNSCVEVVNIDGLNNQYNMHVLRTSKIKSSKFLEMLVNWLYHDFLLLQQKSNKELSQADIEFCCSLVHDIVIAWDNGINQQNEQIEALNPQVNLRSISLHIPKVRQFQKTLPQINQTAIANYRQRYVQMEKNSRSVKVFVHPMFDVFQQITTHKVQMHPMRDPKGLVRNFKDFQTYVQFSTVQAELSQQIIKITNTTLESDSPLSVPVIDINGFENQTYVHCFPLDHRRSGQTNSIQVQHHLWQNAADIIRVIQDSIVSKDLSKVEQSILFEISFKRYVNGDQFVYAPIDEGVLHKIATTKVDRITNTSSVDYNMHVAKAFNEGFIAQNNHQVNHQPRFGEVKDARTYSGYGLFYCWNPNLYCALAVVCNLVIGFMGALAPFEPEIHISKRQLKVPPRILKLPPKDYEYKISQIHEFATKNIEQVVLHSGNKINFYKTTTPILFGLGNLLKGQILYGVDVMDMQKHPMFRIKFRDQPIISYLYHYRIRDGVVVTPWILSEGMLELQQAIQSTRQLKDFQQKFGKYEHCQATYFLLQNFGGDVTQWDVYGFMDKQLQLLKDGAQTKFSIDELTNIITKIEKMPTLDSVSAYNGVLKALPLLKSWSQVLNQQFQSFSLLSAQVKDGIFSTLNKTIIQTDFSNTHAFLEQGIVPIMNEIIKTIALDSVAYEQQKQTWRNSIQGRILLKEYKKGSFVDLDMLSIEAQLQLDQYQIALRLFNQFNIPACLQLKRKQNLPSTYGGDTNTFANRAKKNDQDGMNDL